MALATVSRRVALLLFALLSVCIAASASRNTIVPHRALQSNSDACALVRCAAPLECTLAGGSAQCTCKPPNVLSDSGDCVAASNCASVKCPAKAHCAVVQGQASCVCQDPLILSDNSCITPCAAIRCAAGYECQVTKKAASCVCAAPNYLDAYGNCVLA